MSYRGDREVTARKHHTCLWCKERIEKGEKYILIEFAEDDTHYRNRMHIECSEAESRLQKQDWEELDLWYDENCMWDYNRGSTVKSGYEE